MNESKYYYDNGFYRFKSSLSGIFFTPPLSQYPIQISPGGKYGEKKSQCLTSLSPGVKMGSNLPTEVVFFY